MSYNTPAVPNDFAFIVGRTGNYPATGAGLQNALNAAFAANAPSYFVFIQESINDPTVGVTVPGNVGTVVGFIGAISCKPLGLTTSGLNIFIEDTVSNAPTFIDVQMDFGSVGTTVIFQNLCYASSTVAHLYAYPDGAFTQKFYFKNSWCQLLSGGINFIEQGANHTIGVGNINIYLDNSYINAAFAFANLFNFTNVTVGAPINFLVQAYNNSEIVSNFSNFVDGVNLTFNISNGSQYVDNINTNNATDANSLVTLIFDDCKIGMMGDLPFITNTASTFTNISLSQQNTNYVNYSVGVLSIYESTPDLTVVYNGFSGSVSNYSQNIGLVNCNFASDTTLNNKIVNSCANMELFGNFTPTLLLGSGNFAMMGTFTGSYVRQGQLATIEIDIALTAKGTSTGNATINLLPFTTRNFGSPGLNTLSVYLENCVATGTTYTSFAAVTDPGTQMLKLFQYAQTASVRVPLTDANINNNSKITVTGTYAIGN